ncbi:hypothetical protein DL769_005660 [Monosporascus sp. CRB-8-3]|nr:hypothetical protein DL769_005660 [Monosporascus sp. CRB-8-3]
MQWQVRPEELVDVRMRLRSGYISGLGTSHVKAPEIDNVGAKGQERDVTHDIQGSNLLAQNGLHASGQANRRGFYGVDEDPLGGLKQSFHSRVPAAVMTGAHRN